MLLEKKLNQNQIPTSNQSGRVLTQFCTSQQASSSLLSRLRVCVRSLLQTDTNKLCLRHKQLPHYSSGISRMQCQCQHLALQQLSFPQWEHCNSRGSTASNPGIVHTWLNCLSACLHTASRPSLKLLCQTPLHSQKVPS